jgi:MbtH protein
MSNPEIQEDPDLYRVVRNHEDQYSIWFDDIEIPVGWEAVGAAAPKAECLQRIETLWTDMQPKSLRAS